MGGYSGLKNALELITVAVLCALFILNVWEHFVRYVNGETTNFFRTTEEDGFGFPAIMICPHRGYKFDKLRQINVSADHWYLDNSWNKLDNHSVDSWANVSVESMEAMYRDTTFAASEIIREVMYYDGSRREQILLYDGESNLKPSVLNMVTIRSLSHGQCVAVKLKDQMSSETDGLRLQTRDTAGDVNLVVAEVSEVELWLGASLDVWNQGETRTLVAANTYTQVAMTKKVQTLLPDSLHCSEDGESADEEGKLRSSCIMEGMSEYLAKNAHSMCYLPQLRNWTLGFPACRDRSNAVETFYKLQNGIWELYSNRTCPESCKVVNYNLKERGRVLSGNNNICTRTPFPLKLNPNILIKFEAKNYNIIINNCAAPSGPQPASYRISLFVR